MWIGKDANEVERTESVKSGEIPQAHIPLSQMRIKVINMKFKIQKSIFSICRLFVN